MTQHQLKVARESKALGHSREAYLRMASDTARRTAKAKQWRQSELAMALADIAQVAEHVWKTP